MPIKNRFAELQAEITSWRHDFHENPEILYDVHRTAGIVADRLRAFGCDEIATGIGRTGVVGVIKGRTTDSGKVIGLRADMDALPMSEQTGLPHASKVPGAMHACGHDGHTAMLLGAAKYLAETRNFDGIVVLIFQPAEEGGKGGLAMVQDGMMDRWNVQEVYGLHNMPGLPVGEFAIRSGPILAAGDMFSITVTGKGGHAAKPHSAVDTTLVASHIVVGLQSIVSRNVDPLEKAVVTVAAIHSDSEAFNVIPQTVELRGTVRTFDSRVRDMIEDRIPVIANGIAHAFGAAAETFYDRGVPATVNAVEQTSYAAHAAEAVSGKVDRDTQPHLGGEDFSFMLQSRPGAFMFIGNGDTQMCHHPRYDFDDNAIPFGSSWFATLVEQRMPVA